MEREGEEPLLAPIERHGISPTFIPLAGFYAGLGSAIGASITYWVARIGGRPMIDKFANLFRIDLGYIAKIEDQCRKWGAGIVMIGRVIPGVRTLVSIPAGLVRIPFPKFFLATFIGAYFWCTLLIGAGYVLGYEWRLISEYIKTHLPLAFTGSILVIVAYLMYHYRAHLPILGWIRTSHNRQEIEVQEGGQPHYQFIISIESSVTIQRFYATHLHTNG